MKTTRTLLLISGLALAMLPVVAQQLATNVAVNTATNVAVNTATSLATNFAPTAVTNTYLSDRIPEIGQPLLSDSLRDRLQLSSLQVAELSTIEGDFAKTVREYQVANQSRLDAAYEADRQARIAKNDARLKAAWEQYELVWSGLQPERTAALARVKPLLTPAQLKVFEAERMPSAE